MRWSAVDSGLLDRAISFPGGTALVDELLCHIGIEEGSRVLDLAPGTGVIASLIAREYKAEVTALTSDPDGEAVVESTASALGVRSRVKAIPGSPAAIPLTAQSFDRVIHVANPFPLRLVEGVVSEILRVTVPGGLWGMIGPASASNHEPDDMARLLSDLRELDLKTPARTALQCIPAGWKVIKAELVNQAHELWNEWLSKPHSARYPESFRRAVEMDKGRWLSLGIIILKRPVMPVWAI